MMSVVAKRTGCHQGLKRWLKRRRRTVSTEIDATTPSRTNCRAISVQSHCDNERPSSSGRSPAILTT
jgi:hypothetical protein